MEVSTMASRFAPDTRTLASITPSRRTRISSCCCSCSFSPARASSRPKPSLSSELLAHPFVGGSVSTDFCGQRLRPDPALKSSGSRGKRGVVTMVIPFLRGNAWEQPPPDLASYLYKNRIVYLGMSLVPSVTELILAEFLYLQYEDVDKPIYLYVNSTGTTKGGEKLGYETEAFAIYDIMSLYAIIDAIFGSSQKLSFFHFRYVKPPIFTLCVGNAWGEAALLLAAGAKGNRSALPSSTIMIKQPIARFQGQASDIDLARKEVKNVKAELRIRFIGIVVLLNLSPQDKGTAEKFVNLLSRHVGKTPEQVEQDIRRPKYFSPSEAVDYGIIDKVLYNERGTEDRGVVSNLKKAQLI
ncbi:hypothetical protein Sjap_004599 [Stephania japonica]|uniref:ATP-dependent Clp protease proteolytic subunit n=1 Tax=Stephania japonica TaxID=461633 RepID=A0AAP0K2S7_9MAGN